MNVFVAGHRGAVLVDGALLVKNFGVLYPPNLIIKQPVNLEFSFKFIGLFRLPLEKRRAVTLDQCLFEVAGWISQ